MKNLVFTAATKSDSIGHLYLEMADLLIASLRQFGNFSSDILVYTDNESWFKDKGVSTRKIAAGMHPWEARFSAALDIRPYHNVMYLDADIICIGDINPLFTARNEVLYVYETSLLMNSMKFGHHFLTQDEREAFKDDFIINSGTYCVDAGYYDYFAGRWKAMWDEYITDPSLISNPYTDQSMLNAILRRKQISCRSIGERVVEFPFIFRHGDGNRLGSLHKTCRFIHYNSDLTQQYKEGDFAEVKEFYREMSPR
jgi:hypothetical protein